jgi:hypothetical protein
LTLRAFASVAFQRHSDEHRVDVRSLHAEIRPSHVREAPHQHSSAGDHMEQFVRIEECKLHAGDNRRRGEASMRTILKHRATPVMTLLLAHPSTSVAAPPTDSCALLTTAQVNAALGGAVGPAKPLATGVCQ